jgi:hypothetical protein
MVASEVNGTPALPTRPLKPGKKDICLFLKQLENQDVSM